MTHYTLGECPDCGNPGLGRIAFGDGTQWLFCDEHQVRWPAWVDTLDPVVNLKPHDAWAQGRIGHYRAIERDDAVHLTANACTALTAFLTGSAQ